MSQHQRRQQDGEELESRRGRTGVHISGDLRRTRTPGRWSPEDRRYPVSKVWHAASEPIMEFTRRYGTAALLTRLAMGQVTESPFEEEAVTRLKEQIVRSPAEQGLHLNRHPEDREDLPVDCRFLQLLLTAAEDPEVSIGEFARGVRVGPGARLPRQPALHPAKKKWSLKQQYDGEDYLTTVDDEDATWRKNYSSLEPWKEKVLEVMEDQTSRGQVLKLTETEARLRFPDSVVASLGAIRKDKPRGVVTARVLFDGTNGIHVNRRTRIRDQERSPIEADLKRLMREKSQKDRRTFALTADVARQVPVDPRDWHMLGCQVEPGGAVYVHTVATFGVASASYYWSRVAGAIGSVAQYCSGSQADTWHLLVADDFHLEAGGPEYRPALLAFFVVCVITGIPLSWPKTAGGDVVSWVGFELLHSSYLLGISERRAAWFVKWTRTTAEQEAVHMAKFEEGLGRVMFVTVA